MILNERLVSIITHVNYYVTIFWLVNRCLLQLNTVMFSVCETSKLTKSRVLFSIFLIGDIEISCLEEALNGNGNPKSMHIQTRHFYTPGPCKRQEELELLTV